MGGKDGVWVRSGEGGNYNVLGWKLGPGQAWERRGKSPVSLPSSLGWFATGDPAAGLVHTKCSPLGRHGHGVALGAVSLSAAAGRTPFGGGNAFVLKKKKNVLLNLI